MFYVILPGSFPKKDPGYEVAEYPGSRGLFLLISLRRGEEK
jgi:hypothetical protein